MPSPSVVQTASHAYTGNIFIPDFRIAAGMFGGGSPADEFTLNAGASAFVGTPPSGYVAWDTSGATTWDPANVGASITLSGGNLTATKPGSTSVWSSVVSNTHKTSAGKFYFEITNVSLSSAFDEVYGLANDSFVPASSYPGQNADSLGGQVSTTTVLGSAGLWPGTTFVQGDTAFICVDLVNGLIFLAGSNDPTNWNNVSGDPTTGTGGISISGLSSETEAAIVWGSQPTPGNLLVIPGFCYQSPPPIPINGWGFVQPPYQVGGAAGTFAFAVFKYAGASEPLTEQIVTNGNAVWGISGFEIDNVTGNPWTDIIGVSLGGNQGSSTTPSQSTAIDPNTSLIVAAAGGNTPTNPITAVFSGNSGAWTTGSLFTSTVTDPQVGYYDWSCAGYANLSSGTASPTCTISVAGFQSFMTLVQIGNGESVGIDPASVLSVLQSGNLSSPGNLTANVNLITTNPNEVVILDIVTGSASAGGTQTPTVTAAGLTFALRANNSIPATNSEFWRYWAEAPTPLSNLNCTVEIAWSGSPGVCGIGVDTYAVGGAASPSSPWDPDASLPAISNTFATVTFNTTDGPDLNLNTAVNTTTATAPAFTGNTAIVGTGNGSNVPSMQSSFDPALISAGANSSTVGSFLATLVYADAISGAVVPSAATGTAAGAGAAAAIGTVLETATGVAAGHATVLALATGIMPSVGHAAGTSGVEAIGNVLGVLEPPFDYLVTVISQYQTSPTLLQLIANMETYIDPLANLDAFYVDIWNIYSAQGYGLDVWGRIVGVTRTVHVPSATGFLGFEQAAPTVKPFGFGIWFDGAISATSNYVLSDNAFRTLILAKALANICNGSIPAMNQILINLFAGSSYGNVYVTDGENMTMTITFTNTPSDVDLAIISQSGVFPRPAGVTLTVVP